MAKVETMGEKSSQRQDCLIPKDPLHNAMVNFELNKTGKKGNQKEKNYRRP